jgi:hypothetical protein
MARKRGALKGARKVSRLLKRLPETVRGEVVAVLKEKAPVITSYSQSAAPSKTGELRRAIKWKVSEKTLRLRIGLFGTKLNADLFRARILERGRRAQTVVVKRRVKGGGKSAYRLRVSPIGRGRYDFLAGRAMRFAIATLQPDLRKVWDRALRKAAGVGDD